MNVTKIKVKANGKLLVAYKADGPEGPQREHVEDSDLPAADFVEAMNRIVPHAAALIGFPPDAAPQCAFREIVLTDAESKHGIDTLLTIQIDRAIDISAKPAAAKTPKLLLFSPRNPKRHEAIVSTELRRDIETLRQKASEYVQANTRRE